VSIVDPTSEVARSADGWVWLRAHPQSLQRRQTLAWTFVTLALGAAAAAVAFLPLVAGLVLAAAGLVVAVRLARRATRAAYTRVGACSVGLLLQMGPRVVQAGWAAIAEVRAVPTTPGRSRLVVATDDGPRHATGATFDTATIGRWLLRAAETATAAGHRVELLDGGPDFALR
jgi:hypothetical protein